VSSDTPRDLKTERYFDEHVPEYGEVRLAFAARALADLAKDGERLSVVDLGCGAGNTLAYLQQQAPIGSCYAVDVSPNLLALTAERTGAETMLGSLLDPELPAKIGRTFDVAVIAAVLHHLIGPTRRASRALAVGAVRNAMDLLKPGGHLVVVEPIFYPRVLMTGVFYVKKALSSLSDQRITLGNEWNNLGAPVVSYYGNEDLEDILTEGGAGPLVAADREPERLGPLNAVLNKTNTTLVAQKPV
jgi:SAM-dependent methyltransferase